MILYSNTLLDPKIRFSERVKYYSNYRLGYPRELIKILKQKKILNENSVIADIGAGTGKLTVEFLKRGYVVYAVEPNNEMREMAKKNLANFTSCYHINGSAENTSLKSNSISIISVAQALHWFNTEKALKEFRRIALPKCTLVLLWNFRHTYGTPFLEKYEELLLNYGFDYKFLKKPIIVQDLIPNINFEIFHFNTFQKLDFEGFRGRTLSCSYIPLPNNPKYPHMIQNLKDIFDKFNDSGFVTLTYDTSMYFGNL